MTKKSKFLFISLLLTFLLTLAPNFWRDFYFPTVVIFTLVAVIFSAVALWDYLSGIEYLTLLSLPALFSLGMVSILFQFPNFSSLFRLVFYGIFFLLFYTLLLSLNIFNVAGEKPIPLLRAAYTSSFLITTFSSLPLFTILYKGYLGLGRETLLIFGLCLVLSFQSLWTVFLPKLYDSLSLKASLIVSLLMVETSLVFSFFPMESFFRSLLLSTFFYIYLGFTHQHLRRSLNFRSLLEYSLIGFLIVALVFLY